MSNEKNSANAAVGQTTRKELGLTQERRNYLTLNMNLFQMENFTQFFVAKIERAKRKMNPFRIKQRRGYGNWE